MILNFRNLHNVKNTLISKQFSAENDLKIHVFKKGDLVFYNECFLIHVFAFKTEEIPYINFYYIGGDIVSSTNVDRFIEEVGLGNKTKIIYSKIKTEYLNPISWDGESNLENCLKVEQNYITYLSVLNIYLPKIFICINSPKTIQNFDVMNMESKMKFQNLIEDLRDDKIL